MLTPGDLIELTIDKPAAGGRMIARHEGRVVFVAGAIPGERVAARVEKVGKGLAHATVTRIVEASADRRAEPTDWSCGGNVFAHVAYARQLSLKAEIVADAFARIGRLPLAVPVPVIASPEHGYRMRARLHVRGHRVGFYREGTHELCDAAATGQLLPATSAWLAELSEALRSHAITDVAEFDLAENIDASERACHLVLTRDAAPATLAPLASLDGLTGLSAERQDVPGLLGMSGAPWVTDRLGAPGAPLTLRRDVRAFFQANRYLLPTLVARVVGRVAADEVVDLYAGVGLFGLSLAAAGRRVTLVEGDRISAGDLQVNARPFEATTKVRIVSVEEFLRTQRVKRDATVVIDPPRTGMSRAALAALLAQKPSAIVYVSCDVATLARDCRTAVDAGYAVAGIEALDLFPNTAHVETVVTMGRR